MWRVTLKGIIAQRLRLALTGLAIVIGVAFVSGTFVFGDTLNKAFDNLFAGIYEKVDVVVQGSGAISAETRPPFDQGLLEVVREVDGVEFAVGTSAGAAQLIRPDGSALSTGGGPALGFSWEGDDSPLNPMNLREGRSPRSADEVLLELQTAERGDFEVGQRVSIILPAGTREYEIVGTAALGDGSDSFAGSTVVFFTLEEAQRAFQKQGQIDEIGVAAAAGVSQAELRDRVAAVLPGDLDVRTGEAVQREASQEIKDQLSFLTIFLLVFGFIAVFIAAFIIFNTFSITVAQRARQLALLRAVGASGGQVTRMVVGEAGVVGLIASVIGLGFGFVVALGVQALFRGFGADLPTTTLQLEARTVVVALLVGILVTLIAALVPAVRAARLPPVAALREDFVLTAGSRVRRLIVGGIVAVVGVVLIGVAFNVDGTERIFTMLGAGALLLFVGLAMLAPLIAGPLASVLGAPLARLGGVPGRLGRGNAVRNPQRTAQTSTALMIGLALVTFVTVFAVSLTASISDEIDRQFRADIVVYDETSFFGFPTAAAEQVRGAEGVEVVNAVRTGPVRVEGSQQFISAADPALGDATFDPQFVAGAWADLDPGGAMVLERFADDRDLQVGDRFEVEVPVGGVQSLVVRGIFSADTGAGPIIVTLADFERWFASQADFLLLVNGRPGSDQVALQEAVIASLDGYPQLTVRNQQEYKEYIEEQVNAFLGLVYALLALAIVIAIFGIVNTLALSVFERTREIGLLRAVGLSARQARRMVRYEAVIVALLGGLLGAVVGVGLGAVTVNAIDEIAVLSLPLGRVVIFFVLAGLAGVLAAIWPARRAARIDVLKAITHD